MRRNWLYLLAMIGMLALVSYIGRAPEETKAKEQPDVSAVGESDVQAEFEKSPRQYAGIEQAQKQVDFEIIIPKYLEQEYIPGKVLIDSESIVEIYYYGDENQIVFRTGQGLGNISGDYTFYDTEEDIVCETATVTAKGAGSRFSLVYFSIDDLKYSLSFEEPAAKQEIIDIVDSFPEKTPENAG